jgi:hypothetical protein
MGGDILLSSAVAFLELFPGGLGYSVCGIHIALEVLVAWVSEELEMGPSVGRQAQIIDSPRLSNR